MSEVAPSVGGKKRPRKSTPKKKPASGKKKPRTPSTSEEKKTSPAKAPAGPATMRDALQVFEQQRQVAALLSHAVATIRTDFIDHGADPILLLEGLDGLKRPADTEAIIAATSAIGTLIKEARQQAGGLLRRPLVPEEPVEERAHHEQQDGLLDLLRLDAVPNPKREGKKKEGS